MAKKKPSKPTTPLSQIQEVDILAAIDAARDAGLIDDDAVMRGRGHCKRAYLSLHVPTWIRNLLCHHLPHTNLWVGPRQGKRNDVVYPGDALEFIGRFAGLSSHVHGADTSCRVYYCP